MLNLIEGGVCAVEGVSACGTREKEKGLALIVGEGGSAGVFTLNKIKSASILVTKRNLMSGKLCAIIANSGCANTFTGEEGRRNAEKMAEMTAKRLNVDVKSIAVASTGIIGHQLDMDLIHRQLNLVSGNLKSSAGGGESAARAIMTTDTIPKQFAVEIKGGCIGGIAKGSGMIAPNMGTMLAFIYTDADLSSNILQRCLKRAVDKSFNMVVVDGDTSPNDTVLLTATGKNDVREEDFQHGLDTVCTALTRMIASDGEGATKLITANVSGAKSVEDARDAVKAILRSPLVKCAIFGMNLSAGPGRVVTAIGNSSAEVDQDLVSVEIDAKDKEVTIDVNLGIGGEKATAWGCDLSYDYVRINSSYSSGISMK